MSQAAIQRISLPTPGIDWGAYPERHFAAVGQGIRIPPAVALLWDDVRAAADLRRRKVLLRAVQANLEALRRKPESQLDGALIALRHGLRREGFADRHTTQALAFAALACERTFGHSLYETQIIAALVVLDSRLAEMATGEGKTLAVAVAAACGALAAIPVHVITANDYLVARDAKMLEPFFARLGLTVGAVTQPMNEGQRREAYAKDITYATAKELVFDYLRDGTEIERDRLRWHIGRITGSDRATPVLRGLCMAIVDEADSILIDEARVPFVLSKSGSNDTQQHEHLAQSLALARSLQAGEHFIVERNAKAVRLTASGQSTLEQRTQELGALWHNRMHRDETVRLALSALHLFERDRHYLVRDGKPVIIDETTGRTAPGRAWSRGLHQLVELKEGCEPSAPVVTAAQITYQRFFPRYHRLAGVSGTLHESRPELHAIYGLTVRRVPLRCASRRSVLPTVLFRDNAALWAAVAERVAQCRAQGRPVLIGTDSVANAHALSAALSDGGLAHSVLSARQDGEEAAIVARAGTAGHITVATNMAGRGTDIPLGDGVAERGGLHVISCQLNAARRIDRQLAGRSARQGDPGSVETWLSLEMSLVHAAVGGPLAPWPHRVPSWFVGLLARRQQRAEERRQALQRKRLVEHDKRIDRQMSFGGTSE